MCIQKASVRSEPDPPMTFGQANERAYQRSLTEQRTILVTICQWQYKLIALEYYVARVDGQIVARVNAQRIHKLLHGV